MATAAWVVRYARRQREWRVIERPRRLVATCPDEWAARRLVDLHATAQAILNVLLPTCEHVPFELLWDFARALGDERALGQDRELRLEALSPARASSAVPSFDEIARELGLPRDRVLDFSKSNYLEQHPDHAVVFNATIADAMGNPLWWGDIDLTVDEPTLSELAQRAGTDLYVYFEGDSRKGFVDKINSANAVVYISDEGDIALGDRMRLKRDPEGRIVRDRTSSTGAPAQT